MGSSVQIQTFQGTISIKSELSFILIHCCKSNSCSGHYNCNRTTEAINLEKKKTVSLMVCSGENGSQPAHWMKNPIGEWLSNLLQLQVTPQNANPSQGFRSVRKATLTPQRGPAKEGQPGRGDAVPTGLLGWRRGQPPPAARPPMQGLAPTSRTRGTQVKQAPAPPSQQVYFTARNKYCTEEINT